MRQTASRRLCFFALALVGYLPMLFAQAPTRNLIAHFNFEDTTNHSLQDVTGNGSNSILVGKPGLGCGVVGSSLSLNGVDDRIIFFGNINNVFSAADWTISLYFKPVITGQAQALFCKADSCNANRFLSVRVSTLQRYVEAKMREKFAPTLKQAFVVGRYDKGCWHHLVVAKSQTHLTVYIDGKEVSDTPLEANYNLSNNAPLTIGEHQCLGPDLVRYKGEIDELYVYSRRLTPTEIKQLYTPIDRISTRDTVVYVGGAFQAHITRTCATHFLWSPSSTVSNIFLPNPTIKPTETTAYTLQFEDENGCKSTDSLYVKVVDPTQAGCSEILLPTSFTPNGDNLNEEFFISNPYAIENFYAFEVYNRWGQRVFFSDDKFARWDGRVGGNLSSTDTYIYKIDYECAGKRQIVSKTFTLMR